MTAYVFGYGSLVNRATHTFDAAHMARISGWRRAWRHVVGRQVAFLTAVPDPASELDGLIANVPDEGWAELDAREHSYDRQLAHDVAHQLGPDTAVHIYHAPPERHIPTLHLHPVILSYLDVVVQGYFREFGEDGVLRFFETTDGWDAPILDDRHAPIYPRHQRLTPQEVELVDRNLKHIGATVIRAP